MVALMRISNLAVAAALLFASPVPARAQGQVNRGITAVVQPALPGYLILDARVGVTAPFGPTESVDAMEISSWPVGAKGAVIGGIVVAGAVIWFGLQICEGPDCPSPLSDFVRAGLVGFAVGAAVGYVVERVIVAIRR